MSFRTAHVLVVDSRGRVRGATLGNDVNLRDIEGRSALLLSRAKDNNASCAIGPFVRLLDEDFDLDTVRGIDIDLRIDGTDGYVLRGSSSMREISRDVLDLVAATHGPHHQYPDGFVLFTGTLFAPTEDRQAPGAGFTHEYGDIVRISSPRLGALVNTVAPRRAGRAVDVRRTSADAQPRPARRAVRRRSSGDTDVVRCEEHLPVLHGGRRAEAHDPAVHPHAPRPPAPQSSCRC